MKVKIIYIAFIAVFASCGKDKEANIKYSPETQLYPKTGIYSVINDSSELVWVGKELSTKSHIGTINLKNGLIEVKNNNEITGEIKIDMTTINVTDLQGRAKKSLEGHLNNEDFFNVQKYPESSFVFKSEPNSDQSSNKIRFEGILTIKGISNPLSFDAIIQEISPLLKANASLSFDRSKYNVRYRSGTFFDDLGDKLILDDIDINMSLVLKNK